MAPSPVNSPTSANALSGAAPGKLVSVVIPTAGRPEMIGRAVNSVLAQTYPFLEVFVVVDGPDPATDAALAAITDSRLRVLRLPERRGPGAARNTAGAVAKGDWIAFLDDDDEWLPDKLERQLAGRSPTEQIVLSCRGRVQMSETNAQIWPRRLPREGEPVDLYLFGRSSLLRGDTYIGTSTMLMPTALFARTQFGLTEQNEDTTLLLRATKQQAARLLMLPDVLAIIHKEHEETSLGQNFSWQDSLTWIDSMGSDIGRQAYSGFCLVTLASQAARKRDIAAVRTLISRAHRRGRPVAAHYLLFASFWCTSPRLRAETRRIVMLGRRLFHLGRKRPAQLQIHPASPTLVG